MGRQVGLAAGFLTTLILGTQGLHQANAVGDTRSLSLHHVHTGEDLTITYKVNGRFDDAALKKLNWVLRDWRKEEAIAIDPEEIDLLWQVYQEVGAKEPIQIICGYRSPDTNEMLRHRSNGVAKFSQHTLGKAIDFYIPGVPLNELRATAMRLQGGGVGFYPTSGSPFVHLDVGSVRAWPRMSREQLVKLFPDGRTVHIPADGTPLPGYQLALAQIERTGTQHMPQSQWRSNSMVASLFGRGQDAEEKDDNVSMRQPVAARKPTVVASAAPTPVLESAPPVPLPPTRPAMFQVASSESRPVAAPPPRPAKPATLASLTANDVITARGYWQGLPEITTDGRATRADGDVTAATTPFLRNDRVPSDVALAYAAQIDNTSAPADVINRGTATVVIKPPEPTMPVRPVKAGERLDDPWLRGVVVTPSMQTAMTTMVFGAPDLRGLLAFMQKPSSAVMMTFSSDPYLGMTAESFTGSAVVFQATVTFGTRTAAREAPAVLASR